MDWSKFWDWSNSEGIKTATAMLFSFFGLLFLAVALADTWKSLLETIGLEFVTSVSPYQIVLGVFVIATALFRQIFFAVKPLEKGTGVWAVIPEVREFQRQFPSRFLLDSYQSKFPRLTLDQFSRAWFQWFNRCIDKNSQTRTLTRGSRCYPAFALSYECLVLAIVGFLAVFIQFLSGHPFTRGLLTVSGLYMLLFLLFRFVWWRNAIREFQEVNDQHKAWLAQNTQKVEQELEKIAASMPEDDGHDGTQ